MSWLLEDPTTVCLFLGVVALILLWLWHRSRDRRYLYGVGGIIAVMLGLWLVSSLTNTDGQQIRGSIEAMGAAVRQKDADGIFRHIAEDFRVRNMDRAAFRSLVASALRNNQVTDVVVWNIESPVVNRQSATSGTATIRFSAKMKGPAVNEAIFGDVEATFALDREGKWKMKSFEVYKPGTTELLPVPGL